MKKILLLTSLLIIAISYIFAAQKKPPKPSYQDLEKKVRMLEKQTRIMNEGWQQCIQDYERLMEDCRGACDGNI